MARFHLKLVFASLALTSLCVSGCERKKDINNERESRAYRSAMVDYRTGRIEASLKSFAKVVRDEPANSSARFLYACLLQDFKRDFISAYNAYNEYLLQQPDSDKAKIATERMRICEKEVAILLAEKYSLASPDAQAKEIAKLSDKIKELEEQLSLAQKGMSETQQRNDALAAERDRLLTAVKSVEADVDQKPNAPSVKGVKELLEEEERVERTDYANDIAKLRAEEKDELATGTTLLPPRTKEDIQKREAELAAKRAKEEELRNKKPSHPPTYVVQEGDTLYRIAVRFYGRLSAWKAIRDANKAIISNDGRVRAGETIVLPGQ